MKHLPLFLVKTAFTLSGLLLITPPSHANPFKAVVYPGSAKVWERSQHRVERTKNGTYVTLPLPRAVDRNSLVVSVELDGVSVSHLSWSEADPDNAPQVHELRKNIESLQKQKGAFDARISAVSAQIRFWNAHSNFQAHSYDNIKELANTLSEELEKGQLQLNELHEASKKINEEIARLQNLLREMSGSAERGWMVAAGLDRLPAHAEEITLVYHYLLNGCGWKPTYRLEAQPENNLVLFSWNSHVWQSSGRNWNDVELSLATVQPRASLIPPTLPDWYLQHAPQVRYERTLMRSAMDGVAGAPSANMLQEAEADFAPQQEKKSAFSIWHLGKRNLPAGEQATITVQEAQWKAKFQHLLRPTQTQNAFIEAEVEFEENMDLPQGEATLALEGAIIGKQILALTDDTLTLYFGEDPFVTTEVKTLERISGRRGLLGNQQSLILEFETTLKNTHDYPVTVRIEDPKPVAHDEKIQLTIKQTPEPSEVTESRYIWNTTLAARQESTLVSRFEFRAPKDMNVDWGWR